MTRHCLCPLWVSYFFCVPVCRYSRAHLTTPCIDQSGSRLHSHGVFSLPRYFVINEGQFTKSSVSSPGHGEHLQYILLVPSVFCNRSSGWSSKFKMELTFSLVHPQKTAHWLERHQDGSVQCLSEVLFTAPETLVQARKWHAHVSLVRKRDTTRVLHKRLWIKPCGKSLITWY